MTKRFAIQKIPLTRENLFIFLAAVMLCHSTLFSYFGVIIGKLPIISIFEPFFFLILYSFLIMFSVNKRRISYIRITDFGILIFFVFAILITMVIFPENEKYIMESMLTDILPCVPFFFLGVCLDLNEKTNDIISRICCAAIVVSVLYVFYFLGTRNLGGAHGENYSMYWSYLLLPNTMIVIDYAFKSRKIIPSLCATLGIIYAFAMGTRGPIVIIFSLVVINIWRYMKVRACKKIVLVSFIGMFVLLFYSSPLYLQSLRGFQDFLNSQGVSTRIVDYLISGEMISYTSGREEIYDVLLTYLNEKPILGYGVFGEYPLGYAAGAHNTYLQVLFNFGVPLGIFLLFSYVFVVLQSLKKTQGREAQNWIVIFSCIVFVRGFFGGSYLDYIVFFLLGIALRAIREEGIKA